MHFLNEFYGNERQKAYFSSLIAENKLSHAYILEAPLGSGKKTFAALLAAALAYSSESDAQDEKKCKRILEGNSPDVRILKREDGKRTIGVEAVRDFCSSAYLTPSELNFKMYIFDEADCLTPQAQNALLKIIEEPPSGVYMFLLAEHALSLLSTVRSRAQKIALDLFSPEELRFYVQKRMPGAVQDEEKLSFAVHMAGGSIGRLQRLLTEHDMEYAAYGTVRKIVECQISKNRGVSYFDFLKLITAFVSNRDALDALTKYLLSAYGDLVRIKHTEEVALSFFRKEEAEKYALFLASETIDRSFSAVDAVRADTQYNTSLSLSAAVLAMALWQAV